MKFCIFLVALSIFGKEVYTILQNLTDIPLESRGFRTGILLRLQQKKEENNKNFVFQG